MTFVRFNPVKEFENFNDKIQNIFGEFPNSGFNYDNSFRPKADIYSNEQNIYVELEVPGLKKEDLKISLKDYVLTVSGEKKNQNKDDRELNYYKSERSFGVFSRNFTLSKEVDQENIQASYENGILRIVVNKQLKEQKLEKEIKIN
jgi:HSP20 family protein